MKTLNQLKREYLQKTAPGTSQTPTGQMESVVYKAVNNTGGSLNQKRQAWMRAKIAALGGTPGSWSSDQLKQFLAALHLPVTNYTAQNLKTLWSNL